MSIYTNTARFDTARALTEDELHSLVPSVFAMTAHESRSERFAPIPTIDVIRGLAKEGFSVVGAKQSLSRIPGKADFTKHLLRIRKLDEPKKVGDAVFEMLLKNANDGTCKYNIMGALFRVMCLNSLVSSISTVEDVTVKHSGEVAYKVIEGTYSVLNQADMVLEAPDKWSRIQLSGMERETFARSAHYLRFADSHGEIKTPIEPQKLLECRRSEDNRNDLWTTFNVVQENALKGGLRGVGRNANNHVVRVRTRPIKGIDQDVKLNKALWMLADKMAEMKQAA